jgi:transmembrane sensor
MMSHEGKPRGANFEFDSDDDEASELLIQRMYGSWAPEDQLKFEMRLERDPKFAQAWKRAEAGWASLDRYAEAPEVMSYRAQAIAAVRRANAGRWYQLERMWGIKSKWKLTATVAGLVLLACVAQLSPHGYHPGEYRTGIGEQRMIELVDHSRIAMDAATRLQVRFSSDSRTVRLLEGQVQFSVAKDPGRPFKVLAGDRAVVAVGTVFTVEYMDQQIHVAMIEGKVAVLAPNVRNGANAPSSYKTGTSNTRGVGNTAAEPEHKQEIDLSAGEELRVAHDGRAVVTPEADLEAATAWREGRVIFRSETLGEVLRRMNRYSHLQLEIDNPKLASMRISGAFDAGDTREFVDALERYLPVTADYVGSDTVQIRAR